MLLSTISSNHFASAQSPSPTANSQRLAKPSAYNGKGIHPAALNFGDCFSYALAKVSNEPLLFKGADFSQTDIISALPT